MRLYQWQLDQWQVAMNIGKLDQGQVAMNIGKLAQWQVAMNIGIPDLVLKAIPNKKKKILAQENKQFWSYMGETGGFNGRL